MKAGSAPRLDRRITFVMPKTVPLGLGETKIDGWDLVADERAEFTAISDAEKLRAAAVERKSDARFVVRWSRQLAALDSTAQIEFDGSRWEITGMKEIGRSKWLEFTTWCIVGPGS
jgi:head-tail adaptor